MLYKALQLWLCSCLLFVATTVALNQIDGLVIPVPGGEALIEAAFTSEGDGNLDYRTDAVLPTTPIDVSTKALVFKIVNRDAAYQQVFAWYDKDTPEVLHPLHSCTEQPPGLPTTQLDVRPNSVAPGPKSTSGRIGIAAIVLASPPYCASTISNSYIFRTTDPTPPAPVQLIAYHSTNYPGRVWYALEDIQNGGDNDFNDLLIWIDYVEIGSICATQANGTACSDGNLCTLGETCNNGACGNPTYTVDCGTTDKCHNPGTCDPSTGLCSFPSPRAVATDGTPCPSDFPCFEEACGKEPLRFGCPIKYLYAAYEDECGGSGGHAMWSAYSGALPWGWGEDRWLLSVNEGIPSGVFQEFSEGYARVKGTLVGVHDANNIFELDLELKYVGTSLDGTPYQIKNELHSTCRDLQNGWWFYELRTDVPSTLVGKGNYNGVTVELGLEGTGSMIVQVGKGASMKNTGWGLTTWLTYQQFIFDDVLWPATDPRPRPNFHLPTERHNDGDLNMNTKCACKCPNPNHPVCGNGIIETGEECDGGDCCNSICKIRQQGFECRLAAGECDITEVCDGVSATCPADQLYGNTHPCNETIGFCDARIENTCSGTDVHCRGVPRLTLGQHRVPWENFNVVSFGNLVAGGGDVEGRVAVCGNLTVGGFSVGEKTNSFSREDNQLDFALFIGHNGKMDSGSIWPDGSGLSTKEDVFVGDTFDAPAYLQLRRTGFSSFIGDRDAECQEAQVYFTNLQNNFASHSSNVWWELIGGTQDGLLVHCHDPTATWYYVDIDGAIMSSLNWYQLDSCNLAAFWIVNIGGTGPVTLKGGRWPSVVERVVYNIKGSGRVIDIQTGIAGNILAPHNILNMVAGVTLGLVVVGDVRYLVQANKPNCIEFDPIDVVAFSAGSTVHGEEAPSKKRATAGQVTVIPVSAYGSFSVGDNINVNGEENCTIIGVTEWQGGEALVCQPPLTKDYPPNTKFFTTVTFTSKDEIIRQPVNSTVISGIKQTVSTTSTEPTGAAASTVASLCLMMMMLLGAILM